MPWEAIIGAIVAAQGISGRNWSKAHHHGGGDWTAPPGPHVTKPGGGS